MRKRFPIRWDILEKVFTRIGEGVMLVDGKKSDTGVDGNMIRNEEIIRSIEQEKIIAIIRGVPVNQILPVAEAMYAGGIRLLEVTFDASGRVSDLETAEVIRQLSEAFDGRMYIGSGTVLTKEQVKMTAEAGGRYIISPDANVDVIRYTKELGLISMPGALTPTEIQTAHLAGADYVKLFPAANFGPAYVKAVKAPLSHIRFMAVGGINKGNIREYLQAGVCGFGIGSNITDGKLIAAEDYSGITKLAEEYCQVIREWRRGNHKA